MYGERPEAIRKKLTAPPRNAKLIKKRRSWTDGRIRRIEHRRAFIGRQAAMMELADM